MSNNTLKLVQSNPEAQVMQEQIEALQKQIKELKELKKEKTKGIAVKLNSYEKDGVKYCGLSVMGLSARPVQLFKEQMLRLIGNTPEAEANRKFILEFIAANEAELTVKK